MAEEIKAGQRLAGSRTKPSGPKPPRQHHQLLQQEPTRAESQQLLRLVSGDPFTVIRLALWRFPHVHGLFPRFNPVFPQATLLVGRAGRESVGNAGSCLLVQYRALRAGLCQSKRSKRSVPQQMTQRRLRLLE